MLSIFSIKLLLFISLISFLSTTFLLPLIIKFARKYNIKDKPNLRKQHKEPKIHIGGISLVLGFSVGICFLAIFSKLTPLSNDSFYLNFVILTAGILFFFIGFIDDLIELSPAKRISLQIFISSVVWSQGVGIYSVYIPFWNINNAITLDLPNSISLLITIIWFVGVTNSINWMDGLDGLASGMIFIASSFLLIIYLSLNDLNNFFICASLAFTNLAFLKFNFYPSKILMGDGGSNFLGFIISVLSLVYSPLPLTEEVVNFQNVNIFIPFLILFIPLFDMTYVIFSRIKDCKSPFFPDRRHIHHRLIEKGLKDNVVVLWIYILSIVSSSLAFCFLQFN